jgi:predicted O-methyltransferase YrrM
MKPNHGVPISPITGVPGWETEPEEEMLFRLAQQVPADGKIVEIGSEYGRSAACFLMASKPSVTMVSVDLFPEDHPLVGDLRATYVKNLHDAGIGDRKLAIVKHDSSSAGREWQFGAIDLLFIDGDHTYEGVLRDIEAWTPHVKVGGFVAFHDCANGANSHPLHFEVSRAVDEWKSAELWWAELAQVDSLRVFRRQR